MSSTLKSEIESSHNQTLFEKSRDGIYRSTPEGEYLDANPSLVKMLGYDSKEELISLNIPKKIYANGAERPGPEERGKIFKTQLKRKNGELFWAEISSWVVRDEEDQILYYEGIVRDITERMQNLEKLHNTKEKMQITLKSIGDGVIVTDVEGKVKMMNDCAEELTGYTQKEVQGEPLTEVFNIVNEYSRKPVKNPVDKVIESGKVEGLANHTVLISKKGKERAIADSAAPINDKEGNITGVVMVFRDVTERREMINKLKFNEKRYRTLFENTGTALAIIREDTIISMVNKKMVELSGYGKQEMEEKMSWEQLVADKNDLERMKEYHELRRQKEGIPPPNRYEFTLKDKKGNRKYILVRVSMIPETKKSIISLIDITERKKYEERIKYLGYHDEMTGLYNRNYFKESLARIDTERQLPISIIMGDVNGLKLINDGFGHNKGDELIKKIADIIKSCCRQEDIIARWGGDEFVILLPQTTFRQAEKIKKRIKRKCQNAETEEPIKPSIALGFATKTEKEEDINEILKNAEKWVYKRKLVESQSIRSSIIDSLEETLLEKNYETREHANRIKKLAIKMGRMLDLPDNKVDELELLASLHDIGKIAINDDILTKTDSLDGDEWEIMKKHSETGYRIAQSCSELTPIAEAILHHHEWWNGTGYPRGLQGKDIPLNSRIITIIDAYDVMLHGRPYKKAMSKKEAINELKKYAGIQFDPELVDIFIQKVINIDL